MNIKDGLVIVAQPNLKRIKLPLSLPVLLSLEWITLILTSSFYSTYSFYSTHLFIPYLNPIFHGKTTTKKVSGDSFAKWQKMGLLNSQFLEVRIMPYKFIKVGVHCFTAFNFRIKLFFPISFG